MTYVDVVFNLAIEKSFTYKIPSEILADISVGQRVLAPFGNRELTGVIVGISKKNPGIKCKDIVDVLDEKPLILDELLHLTQWMAGYYLCSWGSALQITLPKGLDKKSNVIVDINQHKTSDVEDLTETQRNLYDLIFRDPGKTTHFYKSRYGTGSFDYNLRVLENKHLVIKRKGLSGERVRKKLIRNYTVSDSLSENISGLRMKDELNRLLQPLIGQTMPSSEFREKTGLSPGRINTLLKRQILIPSETEVYRHYFHNYNEKQEDIVLNEDQKHVLKEIYSSVKKSFFKVFLLHGVTGSGKTQVYLEAIKSVLESKKSAIVLIPEISLTPQTVGRFKNFFQEEVYVFHSRMTLGERYDTWRLVQESEKCIVIGPRSALFLPVRNLGMVIVDEEHDGSFKQESPAPRYHARDTAIYRAKINNAIVILGSATPSLESYHNVYKNKYHLLKLEKRIDDIELPRVNIVNMMNKSEGEQETKIFSPELLSSIRLSVEKREQVILLQNRRGFSSYLQCELCGHTNKCPDCDIHLTYHASSNNLQCHYCGYSTTSTNSCIKCGGTQIKYVGAGTQKIEAELQRLIPQVKILRMDVDTTTMKNAHEKILKRFKDREADILLGTQMIAKGLDFDNVSLVGVISADIGLTLPDFRSSERIFQLLTQVSGRAGRKKKQGQVVIQTGMQNHYAIQFAQNHDFEGFFSRENIFRKASGYPPFTRLIKIGITSDKMREVNVMAREIVSKLKKYSKGYFTVIGPSPAPVIRLKNKYRWQVLLKLDLNSDRSGKKARRQIKTALDSIVQSKKGIQSVSIDVDPIDMM